MTQQVKIETLRKLIRDIDTEIRELKDYSKFAEAKRCSIRESWAMELEKTEKIKDCVDRKDSATACSQIKTTQKPEEKEGLTKC